MRLKSYIWQRDRIVGMILCFSVVARMKIACCGGSSSVFRKALNAALREHVYLVDDEYRVLADLRNHAHLLYQVAYVLDGVVRRGVEFVDVERASLVERAARVALVARLRTDGVKTVDCLGEDAGAGGLADSARSAKQIGVSQLVALDCIFQRRGDVLLPDDACECRRTVFSCRYYELLHNHCKGSRFFDKSETNLRRFGYLSEFLCHYVAKPSVSECQKLSKRDNPSAVGRLAKVLIGYGSDAA